MPPLGWRLLQAKRENKKNVQTAIEADLAIIRGNVSNIYQVDVFGETVKQVVNHSKFVETETIEHILQSVKVQILANRGKHQACRDVLKEGSHEIRLLLRKRKRPEKLEELCEMENEAIERDRRFEKRHEERPNQPQRFELQIYSMEQPGSQSRSIGIRGTFSTYSEIVWYLQTHGMVYSPELWIRCEGDGIQTITDSGYWWKRVRGTEGIEDPVIYTMSRKGVVDYHVALVHEGDTEFPVVLRLPLVGEKCCDPACSSLGEHLVLLWKDRYTVCRTLRIRDPEKSVFDVALNTLTFQNQENDLYVQVEKRDSADPIDMPN
ncbi:hypothetical protein FRC17_007966 [Serendipita sp. 399]|nr:hypothetical protein FRC17_007966 [Serendipita sp. 399]